MIDTSKNDLADMLLQSILEKQLPLVKTAYEQAAFIPNFWAAASKYFNDFNIPALLAMNYMSRVEGTRMFTMSPLDNWKAYGDMLQFNLELSIRGLMGTMKALNQYGSFEFKNGIQAVLNSMGMCGASDEGEGILEYIQRHSETMEMVTHKYPQAICG